MTNKRKTFSKPSSSQHPNTSETEAQREEEPYASDIEPGKYLFS